MTFQNPSKDTTRRLVVPVVMVVKKMCNLYSYKDIEKLEKFMKGKPVAEQEVKQLLLETVGYAETSVCRRRVLLNYFGESYNESNCGNCDNCLHPKKSFDGKEEMCTVLEAVLGVKENSRWNTL